MRVKQQQGRGCVIFLSGIVGDNLIGPFRLPGGVKMDYICQCYIKFLTDSFFL